MFISELGIKNDWDHPFNAFKVGKMIGSLNIGKPKLERIKNQSPVRGYWIYEKKLMQAIGRFGIKEKDL